MVEFLPIRLAAAPKSRLWGGDRLGHGPGIGETWVIHDENRVIGGPFAGETLGAIVARHGAAVLGTRGQVAANGRFPLLIKLLDTRDWLSIQVHPDDRLAVELEGAGTFGKAEAWHILAADPGARMISGLKPGLSPDAFAAVIDRGELLEWARFLDAVPGDTIYNRPGLIHALGPGITLYEVQQNSDVTYRVWDWNRPTSAARPLHIAQSRAAAALDAAPAITPGSGGEATASPSARLGSAGILPASRAGGKPDITAGAPPSGAVASDSLADVTTLPDRSRVRIGAEAYLAAGASLLTRCAHFTLWQIGPSAATLDPAGERFHALTVVEGVATVRGHGWCETLARLESILVPASAGPYVVSSDTGSYRALVATVP